ncbi:uncharacterized protein N7443_003637 [Penicillium atrosanguineum]|uniref:uncharacterized protein n=1 Tax=Penicillium atrosanguineum TaxID=1132637 RepID=UPI00238EFA71|nr:uncharacterized protein N7443_003637 [Penicillium atrosanguineum]KAJ5134742.1 hypothetical protein N7526_006107 [Penicillium atrosanguineum]KAJ5303977.1 hypothetical protein N7443_003637 [Penicillium atrosanguineum]
MRHPETLQIHVPGAAPAPSKQRSFETTLLRNNAPTICDFERAAFFQRLLCVTNGPGPRSRVRFSAT